MGHDGDVIAELETDHREVEWIFRQIEGIASGDKRRRLYADQAVIELVRHSVAEEMYLYPAVREYIPGGNALADREIGDHSRAEQIMKDLEGVKASRPEFDRLIAELMREIGSHIRDEEDNLFPRLRASASPETLRELGDQVRQAKKTAPTRPHPAAPHYPPANKALAPGVGMVDRLRDALTGRGRER